MREVISSIDIGSDKIKLVVGEYLDNSLNILSATEITSKGFENYEITNENLLIKQIKKAVEETNNKLNIKLKKVIVNIPTTENNFVLSDGVTSVKGEEGVVNSSDILKAIQASTHNQININDELISALPINFIVGEVETKEPFLKVGKTISTKTVLVTADKKEVYNMISVLEKCNLEVIDITTTGLVDYFNFKNNYLDTTTGIVVNLGHSKTEVSVFSRGIYVNHEVLPVGGYNIDNDISLIYKLDKEDAQCLKENLSLANLRRANPKDVIEITNLDGENLSVNQYELTEIVSSRITEILKLVKTSINHLTKKKISYIIITGGLTELKDFDVSLTSLFGDTAKIGEIKHLGVRNNKYSVCTGMIEYFKDKLRLRHREYSTLSNSDIENMCTTDSKLSVASDSILGKVFGYFFDN